LLGLEIPGLYWIKCGRGNTLIFFLILEEIISVFPHLVWYWLCLSYIAFIILIYVPSIPSFFRF
jgi:hypothetical protein